MGKISKNLKEAGIERCASAKDVKIFFHPASVKMWLTIAIAIIALSGSARQAWNWTWYDFLKYPRNTEEKIIQHMIYSHMFTGEKAKEEITPVRKKTCQLVSKEYGDGCISTSLVNKDGKVEGLKVHATKQTVAMLAKRHKVNIVREVEAGYQKSFNFGYHAGDRNYYESFGKHRGEIIRIYLDEYKCRLSYIIDDRYGNTYGWQWIRYDERHR